MEKGRLPLREIWMNLYSLMLRYTRNPTRFSQEELLEFRYYIGEVRDQAKYFVNAVDCVLKALNDEEWLAKRSKEDVVQFVKKLLTMV